MTTAISSTPFGIVKTIGLNHHNCPATFSHHDIELLKLDPDKYFNAGVLSTMPEIGEHQFAIDTAGEKFGKLGPVKDFGDQII